MPKIILNIKLYSVKEFAELLGVTQQTAQKYISDGKLEAPIIGGKRMVSEESIKNFLTGGNKR